MAYDEELGSPESPGTFILPILERLDEVNQRKVDNEVKLEQTLTALLKFLNGYGGDSKGGRRGSAGNKPERNPLQPKNPSNLMNAFSWIGEKKDKTLDFIKKGFFKLFKTDYFGNLFKAINNLAKALTNSFMSWLKFFLMMAFIDPSGGFLRDIINLFTEIGMILFKTIMPLIPVAIKMMFDTIVYVFKLVLRLIPEIITTIMQTFTQLGNTFPILKPIIGFINQFLSAIRSLFVILNDPKADKGKGFQNFLNKVFKILGNIVEKVLDFVVEKAPIVFNALVDFISNTVIPALIKYVPKILDAFSDGIAFLIKKYPNLQVWIQPFKDILDMLSAYIGSFAKFDETEYIKGLDDYQKKEKELFNTRAYRTANEEKQLKMLSDMQYSFIIDNKNIVKKAQDDFTQMTNQKTELAKQKWDELLTHIMDTLGKTYNSLPTEAKVGIWAYIIITVISVIASIVIWFSKIKTAFLMLKVAIQTFGFYIGEFIAWIQLYAELFFSYIVRFGSYIFRFIGLIWSGITAVFEAVIGAITSGALLIGAAIWIAIIGILYYFRDELLVWALNMFGPDSFMFRLLNGLFTMVDNMIEWILSVIPDWLKPNSSTSENTQKPSTPSNVASTQNTFEELQQQRADAERNYLKSSQFPKDISLYKKEEAKSMARVGAFDYVSNEYTKSFKDQFQKNPPKVELKAISATEIQLPPIKAPAVDVKLDMKNANTSLTTFSDKVSNVFFGLGRFVQKVLGGIPGMGITKLTRLQDMEIFDMSKYTTEEFAGRKAFYMLDEKLKGSLSKLEDGNTIDSKSVKEALRGSEYEKDESFVGKITELMTFIKQGKGDTTQAQAIFNIIAQRLTVK